MMSQNSKLLEIKNLSKAFNQGGQVLEILQNINYTLEPGKIVGLIGASGAGKSTLLQIIGLLDQPDSGEIFIKDVKVSHVNDKILTRIRGRHIGFVYQAHHLLPAFTALENVVLQDLLNGIPEKIAIKRAKHILHILQLDSRLHHYPAQLSGGEQQRVAIARAVVKAPALILADEPTGNLDPHNADLVFNLFIDIVRELNLSALIASHNEQLMLKMDEIIALKNGQIVTL